MRVAFKDMLAGLVFIGFGVAFIIPSVDYGIGSAREMGPGYFPTVLGGLLALLGAIMAVRSVGTSDGVPLAMPSWRGLICLLGAVLFFGMSVHPLGLLPALFGTGALGAAASRENNWFQIVLLAAGLAAICVVIFVLSLGASIPLLGPALPF
jgi:putative exporter of polyketide antibiotics